MNPPTAEPYSAIHVVVMPRGTNPYGTIFGGGVLSDIDMTGGIAAQREIARRGGVTRAAFVTVAMNY